MRMLRTLELFNVAWVPACLALIWVQGEADSYLLRSVALALVAYVVLQGGIYWHLKATSLATKRRQLPSYFEPLFRVFSLSNRMLFVAFGGVVVWVGLGEGVDRSDLGWGLGLFLFAILEHVNYYHYQLMHDTKRDLRYLARHRRLRRSALRSDLDAVQRGRKTGGWRRGLWQV